MRPERPDDAPELELGGALVAVLLLLVVGANALVFLLAGWAWFGSPSPRSSWPPLLSLALAVGLAILDFYVALLVTAPRSQQPGSLRRLLDERARR